MAFLVHNTVRAGRTSYMVEHTIAIILLIFNLKKKKQSVVTGKFVVLFKTLILVGEGTTVWGTVSGPSFWFKFQLDLVKLGSTRSSWIPART